VSVRETKRRNLSKVSVGDLRDRIKIKRQNLEPGIGVDFDIDFDDEIDVWASVNSLGLVSSSPSFFSDTNINEAATHTFKIRYIKRLIGSEIDKKYYINYQGNNYRIIDISDPDRRGMYLYIRATIRGQSNDIAPSIDNPLNRI